MSTTPASTSKVDAPSVALREAGAEAAEQLAALHARIFGDKAWNADAIRQLFEVEGTEAMLAEVGDEPVGLIIHRMLWGDGEILTLGVASEHRRGGIGSRLLATAMNGMVMQGVNRVFLEVAVNNEAAIAMYESMGFDRLGRRPGYYLLENGRKVDALMMARIFGVGCGG